MVYTPQEILDVINIANTALYRMPVRIDEDKMAGRPTNLEDEMRIIYDLRSAVEDNRIAFYNDEEFHGVVSYLYHKVSGYGYDGVVPYYGEVATATEAAYVAPSGYQFFTQVVVGSVDLPDGATSYTNLQLAGRYITVILDGIILPAGVTETESYTYNMLTGQIDFNMPLSADRVLQIYTYVPSLAGWTLFDSFIIGDPGQPASGALSYTDAGLIGYSVIVIIGGLILPFELTDSISYTFNSLTGTITFNTPLPAGQQGMIYTY